MTRPVIPRPGIKIRNRQRREGKMIKAAYYSSPEYLAYAAENRAKDAAHKGRVKVRRGEAGDSSVLPLTPTQFAALTPPWQSRALAAALYPVNPPKG